ncbi:hypothetical protein GCM10010276_84870 [Streptomyces longisporus]|uniref:Uncharacterized protein n=1 Tax=Streptomyces longisporus TaxID=1948 RepID=A0ABN3NG11_STRLO
MIGLLVVPSGSATAGSTPHKNPYDPDGKTDTNDNGTGTDAGHDDLPLDGLLKCSDGTERGAAGRSRLLPDVGWG